MSSISSSLLTCITTARNPQGNEEGWFHCEKNGCHNTFPKKQYLIAAEFGFALSILVAGLETAVSGFFTLASIPLIYISDRPFDFTAKWLESSSFSLGWAMVDLFANFIYPNLHTTEGYAKSFLSAGHAVSHSKPQKSVLSESEVATIHKRHSFTSAASIASNLMTNLVIARNPAGSEANWWVGDKHQLAFPMPTKKVLLTAEIGFALSAVVASVETAVSAVLTIAFLPFSIISEQPVDKCSQWFKSSSFSLLWSLGNLLNNFDYPNLYSEEKLAREFAFGKEIARATNEDYVSTFRIHDNSGANDLLDRLRYFDKVPLSTEERQARIEAWKEFIVLSKGNLPGDGALLDEEEARIIIEADKLIKYSSKQGFTLRGFEMTQQVWNILASNLINRHSNVDATGCYRRYFSNRWSLESLDRLRDSSKWHEKALGMIGYCGLACSLLIFPHRWNNALNAGGGTLTIQPETFISQRFPDTRWAHTVIKITAIIGEIIGRIAEFAVVAAICTAVIFVPPLASIVLNLNVTLYILSHCIPLILVSLGFKCLGNIDKIAARNWSVEELEKIPEKEVESCIHTKKQDL